MLSAGRFDLTVAIPLGDRNSAATATAAAHERSFRSTCSRAGCTRFDRSGTGYLLLGNLLLFGKNLLLANPLSLSSMR